MIKMINSISRSAAAVLLTLCAFILAACSEPGQRSSIPGSGPPASAEQITSFFSGKSYPTDFNGETYYAANGTVKSFQYFKPGPHVCTGTWRASGSSVLGTSRCNWVGDDGKIKSGGNKKQNFQVRLAGGYMDLMNEKGEFIGSVRKGYPVQGFPREAEFNKLSKQLGL